MAWIIGDIHGCYEALDALLAKLPDEDRLIFVGDYIDRGPASAAVVERLLREKKRSVFLKGNHESMLLAHFRDPESLEGQSWTYHGNGGQETLKSYDLATDTTDFELLPAAHRRFYEELELYYEGSDFIAVHAGVRVPENPDAAGALSMEAQDTEDLLWIRMDWINSEHRWAGKKVYYGHTPTRYITGKKEEKSPVYGKNSIGLDTGCVYGGYLTAVHTVTNRLIQVASTESYM